jgi:hypothetical protein
MIYLFIFILLLYCVFLYDIQGRVVGRKMSVIFVFISLVLLVTLRYRVGGDALFYEDIYPELPDLSDYSDFVNHSNFLNYQPLWILLVSFTKTITSDIILFQLIHSLIFNISLWIFLQRYSLKPFSVLTVLFVSLLYFYFSFEIQRETVAISIFMLSIKYLEEKKWLIYFPLAILSFLFHISAVLLFVIPLMSYIKFNQVLLWLTLFSSVLVFIFRDAILSLILSLLFTDTLRTKMEVYAEFKFSALGFWAFYFVRVFLLIPIMLFNVKNNLHEQRFRWFYPTFFVVSVMAQFFVGFERLLNYMFPVYMIIVVDFFYEYYPKIENRIQKVVIGGAIVLHIFFIMNYKLFLTNDFGQKYASLFFPYTSIFNQEIIPEREEFYENLWD